MSQKIFVPLVRTNDKLSFLTLQTFGRPLRYFTDSNDQNLRLFYRTTTANSAETTSLDPIVFNEKFTWDVEYAVGKINSNQGYYLEDDRAIQQNSLTNLTDLFNLEMPGELRMALLQVIANELKEPEVNA